MKKAVILLADGFEEIEALSPADYLRRAGAEVIITATGTSSRTVEGAHGISVIADMTLDAYFSSENELPDAVIIPGGMPGAKNISECNNAVNFISRMFSEKKIVAAICASPAVVLAEKTKILEDRNWTCYPGMEKNVHNDLQKNHCQEPFVTDGNLITGRGPGAAEQFSMEIVKALFGDEKRKEIMRTSVQRNNV